mgnify:CR=1 FL=1
MITVRVVSLVVVFLWLLINVIGFVLFVFFFFQAEDGIRYLVRSRGLGDVYKRQADAFGPQWEAIRDLVRRVAALTPAELDKLDAAGYLSLIHI